MNSYYRRMAEIPLEERKHGNFDPDYQRQFKKGANLGGPRGRQRQDDWHAGTRRRPPYFQGSLEVRFGQNSR